MFNKTIKKLLLIHTLLLISTSVFAQNRLENIDFSTLPGNKLQIALELAQPANEEPLSFTINDPARIAIDLLNTSNGLKQKSIPISVGVTSSIKTVEAGGKTRVVLNLSELVQYNTEIEGNTIFVTLGAKATESKAPTSIANTFSNNPTTVQNSIRSLDSIDFRRGSKGEGRIIIDMSNPSIAVDINEDSGRLLVDFINADMPEELIRRLDVIDFATPVKTIDAFKNGRNSRLVISTTDTSFDHLAYQSDDIFTIEVKKIAKAIRDKQIRDKFGYTGERLSLNFQDIEVRSVLQLIADFTNLNVVVSDTVVGKLTLRLKNVPWDQALDIILNSKGLDKRKSGNVLLIAPTQEIATREKLELEAQQQVLELAPLRTEFIQINYAKAEEIATLLGAGSAGAAGGEGEDGGSSAAGSTGILSGRGSVAVDVRTNTLIVNDTSQKLSEIRNLVSTLDVAVSQVLIESRIVIASDDFNKDIGVNLGVARDTTNSGGSGFAVAGSADGLTQLINNDTLIVPDTYAVNLSTPNAAGNIALALASLPFGTFLDLELSALQAEERGEIVSSPRIITSNQQEAFIEQGVEIPFAEESLSGGTTVEFRKAVLSLRVTPQITPDDRVIMDIIVNNDTVGELFGVAGSQIPSIDTREVQTQVLVDNGETVVLGGIFEQTTREAVDKVPFFGDLPVLGRLFKRTSSENDKSELLIFITPKILRDSIVVE